LNARIANNILTLFQLNSRNLPFVKVATISHLIVMAARI